MALTIRIKANFWITWTTWILIFNKYSKVYGNFIFVGDFNVTVSDKAMEDFCSQNNLESLINKPTYYKNDENPTCIDLILTNRPGYVQ